LSLVLQANIERSISGDLLRSDEAKSRKTMIDAHNDDRVAYVNRSLDQEAGIELGIAVAALSESTSVYPDKNRQIKVFVCTLRTDHVEVEAVFANGPILSWIGAVAGTGQSGFGGITGTVPCLIKRRGLLKAALLRKRNA
jgi:hypothetical protein